MLENFKILTCFSRSFDKHHTKENIHLIASTILIENKDGMDINNFIELMRYNSSKKIFYVIEIFEDGKENNTDFLFKVTESVYTKDFLVYIKLSFNDLLLNYNKSEGINYIEQFYNPNFTDKNSSENLPCNQCLFVFNNITWSNIVFKFKINKIDLSGGGTTVRHILTSSDIMLNNYLNMIYSSNLDRLLSLGFNTYKSQKNIMSGQIPLSYYRTILSYIPEIFQLKPEDLFNNLKLLPNYNINNEKYARLMAENILLSRDLILNKMVSNKNEFSVENIQKKIEEQKMELSHYEVKLSGLFSLYGNMGSSKKKKLKKERKEILNQGFSSENLSQIVNKLRIEISELEIKLSKNMESIEKYREELQNLSISALFQKYEDIQQNIFNPSKKILFSKNKKLQVKSHSSHNFISY